MGFSDVLNGENGVKVRYQVSDDGISYVTDPIREESFELKKVMSETEYQVIVQISIRSYAADSVHGVFRWVTEAAMNHYDNSLGIAKVEFFPPCPGVKIIE